MTAPASPPPAETEGGAAPEPEVTLKADDEADAGGSEETFFAQGDPMEGRRSRYRARCLAGLVPARQRRSMRARVRAGHSGIRPRPLRGRLFPDTVV